MASQSVLLLPVGSASCLGRDVSTEVSALGLQLG